MAEPKMIELKMTWDGEMSDPQFKAIQEHLTEQATAQHPGCTPAGVSFYPVHSDNPEKPLSYNITATFTEASA